MSLEAPQEPLDPLGATGARRKDLRPWYERPYGLAAILMTLLVGAGTFFLAGYVGWLAFTMIGVLGLMISARLQINDGDAVPDYHYGSTGVYLISMQRREREKLPPELRHHHAHEQRERNRLIKAVNGIWIAYLLLGLVMFARQNGAF